MINVYYVILRKGYASRQKVLHDIIYYTVRRCTTITGLLSIESTVTAA